MATQVIVYVDPDATGAANGTSWGDAYTSLNTALSTEEKDITAASGSDEQYSFYCRALGGTTDTTAATVGSNWLTATDNYVEIIGFDFPSDGVFDATKYNLNITDGTSLIFATGHVRLKNLQVVMTNTAGTTNGIYSTFATAGSYFLIDGCILKGVCSGTGGAYGIRAGHTNITMDIINTVVYDILSGVDDIFYGMFFQSNTVNVYNSIVYNCRKGIFRSSGTVTVKDTAVNSTSDDFTGSFASIDYCCSDDGDGTNSLGPVSGSWANEYVNAAAGDFTPVLGGNILVAGQNDPGSGLFSTDIIGASYVTDSWSRNAYAGVPATGGRQLVNYGGAINSKLLVGRIG